ncbi:RNA polymerase sigma factor [Sunxiuqinia elliptica]|uniref:RNA polymerase sigma factor n=1 Tax=Sunxiuqinia elliptica TaxID=655355 RepID=UPI0014150C37|nr:RNA polymerase sigma factor [Sunxiuqinia elliptica]
MIFFRQKEKGFKLKKVLNGCKWGDLHSQEQLYREYYAYVRSIALRYASSDDFASEITNDTFLKVFKHISTYNENSDFKAWIRRITINTSLDYNKKEKKYQESDTIDETIDLPTSHGIEETLNAETIILLLQQLPPLYRMTFNLHEIEGFSHEEIARMMNIKTSTSRANLTRAKKELRVLIQNLNHHEK